MSRVENFPWQVARCWLLLVTQGLVVAAARAQGAEVAGKDEALPFSKLELALRLSKTEYVLGEPITIYARLTNPNPKPVRGHDGWGWFGRGGTVWNWRDGHLFTEFARDGRNVRIHRPYDMGQAATNPPRPVLIAPGEVRRAKQLIAHGDPRLAPLLVPGTITVTVGYVGRLGIGERGELPVVRSNSVDIRIRAPEGQDAELYRWLQRRVQRRKDFVPDWHDLLPYLGYVYCHRSVFNDGDITGLKHFVEMGRRRDSVYAPYAAYALAQMYFYRRWYEETIAACKQIVDRYPQSSIAEDALYLIGESYRQQKEYVLAEKWFGKVIERYPDTLAADDAKAALPEIAQRPEMRFRDDHRLDMQVTLELPARALVADAFEVVRRRAQVPLRLAPEFGRRGFREPIERTLSVRHLMAELETISARWQRDGDGYRLVPVDVPTK